MISVRYFGESVSLVPAFVPVKVNIIMIQGDL